MQRAINYIIRPTILYDHTVKHHNYPSALREVTHDPKVVTNEQVRQAPRLLKRQ